MIDIFMGLVEILVGFWTLYKIYRDYIQQNKFDKYDQEFFQRNHIVSKEDTIMLLYGGVGIYDIISSLTFSSAFNRMCGMVTGVEFLASAAILYFVTRV